MGWLVEAVGIENNNVRNFKDLRGTRGNAKSLKRNDEECTGIPIAPSKLPRFSLSLRFQRCAISSQGSRRLAVDSPICLSVVLWTKAQLQSGIQSDRLHRPCGLTVGNLERVTRRAGAAHQGARSIGTVPPPAPWFEMHLRSAMAMLKLIPRRRIAERP